MVIGWAFVIPDTVWSAVASALLGSLVAGGVVALFTQHWIERRERRNRRDELRLDLYLQIVDLVLDNELAIAEGGAEGANPAVELQVKRLRVSHRLKLLGSPAVQNAYEQYRKLVFRETAQAIQYRPDDPDEVVRARDQLLKMMSDDLQAVSR